MGFRQHQFGECLIVGHRGAAGLAPENTLPGFELAVGLGVDAIELDVHWAHDELWVIHDASLDRTTNAKGRLCDQPPEFLRQVDAGGGAGIPTLAEVMAAIPPHVGINIELKGPGCAAPLADYLRRERGGQGSRDLLVSAFAHADLARLHQLCPEIPVAPLFSRWRADAWVVAAQLQAWSVNLAARLVTRKRTAAAHARGLRVLAYTVNDRAVAERLAGYEVDGIFTDYPDGRLRVDD